MKMEKSEKEEQVEVMIRLRPVDSGQKHNLCVHASNESGELIVRTQNKNEVFWFDHVADEHTDQAELFRRMGKDIVQFATQGYNCSIFAYGQTGAGKTYSILGNSADLIEDCYCVSRGILPRLLSNLFDWSTEVEHCTLVCSYMEIYNEQILDLLNPEVRVLQLREDTKQGVFVEGIIKEKITSYPQAIQLLLKGLKHRKIASTSLNNESSRSHTIFSIMVEFRILESERQTEKYRKAKVNVIDLAGSERAKLTKVEGERLKEGCNINRSLHVLGNVINALVESSRKKKHVPFRDSKLTYFLKDSLAGNSITKLLVNIDPRKQFLGDTLSTLKFAKRAKILRMKVEVQETISENFEALRNEIRKLRQELAETRYLKNQSKFLDPGLEPDQETLQLSHKESAELCPTNLAKHEKTLQILEENEQNYKTLIEIYEEQKKAPHHSNHTQFHFQKDWKDMERRNQALVGILRNLPVFTKIFKENLLLKVRLDREMQLKTLCDKSSIFSPNISEPPNFSCSHEIDYQLKIKSMQTQLHSWLTVLETAHEELVQENHRKDIQIRELAQNRFKQDALQELANENEYLKLNVLELEENLRNYEFRETRVQFELLTLKEGTFCLQELQTVLGNLENIKLTLLQETQLARQDLKHAEILLSEYKKHNIKLLEVNRKLNKELEELRSQAQQQRTKMHELIKISNEIEIMKDGTYTFWTNEESNFTLDFLQADYLQNAETTPGHPGTPQNLADLEDQKREMLKEQEKLKIQLTHFQQENILLLAQIAQLQSQHQQTKFRTANLQEFLGRTLEGKICLCSNLDQRQKEFQKLRENLIHLNQKADQKQEENYSDKSNGKKQIKLNSHQRKDGVGKSQQHKKTQQQKSEEVNHNPLSKNDRQMTKIKLKSLLESPEARKSRREHKQSSTDRKNHSVHKSRNRRLCRSFVKLDRKSGVEEEKRCQQNKK